MWTWESALVLVSRLPELHSMSNFRVLEFFKNGLQFKVTCSEFSVGILCEKRQTCEHGFKIDIQRAFVLDLVCQL